MSQEADSQPVIVVVNNCHAPLTAYNLRISFDTGPMELRFDALTKPEYDSAIRPGESQSFPIVTRRTSPSLLPSNVEIIGALFADGTSAGDATAVAELQGHRQGCLSQLQAIAEELRVLSGQHLDTQALLASIEWMRQTFVETSLVHAQTTGGSVAYALTKAQLSRFQAHNPNGSGDEAIAAALKMIERHITALQTVSSQPEDVFSK